MEALKRIDVAIPSGTLALLYVVLAVTVGIAASKALEMPICAVRDRLFPRCQEKANTPSTTTMRSRGSGSLTNWPCKSAADPLVQGIEKPMQTHRPHA
jgi:hypothetical protein